MEKKKNKSIIFSSTDDIFQNILLFLFYFLILTSVVKYNILFEIMSIIFWRVYFVAFKCISTYIMLSRLSTKSPRP